jgi:hypothetical protein
LSISTLYANFFAVNFNAVTRRIRNADSIAIDAHTVLSIAGLEGSSSMPTSSTPASSTPASTATASTSTSVRGCCDTSAYYRFYTISSGSSRNSFL